MNFFANARRVAAGLVLSVFFANGAVLACSVEDVDYSFGTVIEGVGMIEALFNGGYAAAAYEDLGEELDDRANGSGVPTSGYFHVYFTYEIRLFGTPGAHAVHFCFYKEADETFEEAVLRQYEDSVSDADNGDPTVVDPIASIPPQSSAGVGAQLYYWWEFRATYVQTFRQVGPNTWRTTLTWLSMELTVNYQEPFGILEIPR